MNDVRSHVAALVAVASPYWAGEAEVVRTYFSYPRTQTQDLFWLRAQAYKEARPFRDLPPNLRDEFLRTGTLTYHPDGPEASVRLSQEVQHFRLLAELIAEISDEPVALTDLPPLREDHKLQELRATYKKQGDLERTAAAFTEGGGGAMFAVLSQLDGGKFERRLAAIFKVIAADERSHGPMEIYAIARSTKSEQDWQKASTIVQEISRQRVLMRNEMFGYPLSPARLQEIDEGKISPWQMALPI